MFDLLVDVGAVEEQRVLTVLPLDGIVAVAGVPDEGVVAGAHEGGIVAAPAVGQVVAVAAGDDVVAVAAVERELNHAGVHRLGVDHVVAARPKIVRLSRGRILVEDGDQWRQGP